MPLPRFVASLCALMLVALSTTAQAAETRAFSQDAFAAAQSAGKPIVVDIAATWCHICAEQKPIIERLAGSEAYDDMVIFHVDFDDQKDVVRSLDARMQSTLIAYAGKTETARSVGDTKAESIEALFRSAIAR